MRSSDIVADDRLHRYALADGKPKNKNGAYRLGFIDGCYIGWAKSWIVGTTVNFHSGGYQKLTPEEKKAIQKKLEQQKADNEKRRERQILITQSKAKKLWSEAKPAKPNHPYLVNKQIPPGRLRQIDKHLLMPIENIHGEIFNLQKIYPNGRKIFMDGGRIKGCFHLIGNYLPIGCKFIVICEGYSTGATIHEATGLPVVVALNTGNLLSAACAWRWRHKWTPFIYAADNDAWSTNSQGEKVNAGKVYAEKACKATGGIVVSLPEWTETVLIGQERELAKPTDFNDIAVLYDLEHVKEIFDTAMEDL